MSTLNDNSVKFKIVDKRLGSIYPLPSYTKEGDAGIDLRAMSDGDISLLENETLIVSCGIAVEMPSNMVGLIVPRSGLGSKGLVIKNTVGVIDSNYRGEIKLALTYTGVGVGDRYSSVKEVNYVTIGDYTHSYFTINEGDRVAQLLFMPIHTANILFVDELSTSNRGDNGFNSSGVK